VRGAVVDRTGYRYQSADPEYRRGRYPVSYCQTIPDMRVLDEKQLIFKPAGILEMGSLYA